MHHNNFHVLENEWHREKVWKRLQKFSQNARKNPARIKCLGREESQGLPRLAQIGRAVKERETGMRMEKTAGQAIVSGWPLKGWVNESRTAQSW